MMLIGMFDSPYVRRVAVTLKHLEIPFEHANWSVGADFERIREFSPLGRVPVLVLDDGTALTDSAAILDAIDDQVGPIARPAARPRGRRAARRCGSSRLRSERARRHAISYMSGWCVRRRSTTSRGWHDVANRCTARLG